MSVTWVSHKGRPILRIDYTGMDEAAMIKTLEESYGTRAERASVLVMPVFTGVTATKLFMDRAVALAREVAGTMKTKVAFVGINRMWRAAYLGVYSLSTNVNNNNFDTEEDAKEWLVN